MNVHQSAGRLDWRLSEAFGPTRHSRKQHGLRMAFDVAALLADPAQEQSVRCWLREPIADGHETRLDICRRALMCELRRRLPELIGRMQDDQRLPMSVKHILQALVALGAAEAETGPVA